MTEYITISAKIDKEKKKKLEKDTINITDLIRDAVEKEIQKKEEVEMNDKIKEASQILSKIPLETIIELIRADRESRWN